ncbi:BbrUII/HgiDII family restriction enzyme [Deinococcus aluminii]|uniref:ATP-binding protein n=1 Tax=Deinococcus aluminii TaxID=1656885 RepID=A0ABP9XEK1_9DEIO
MATPPIPPDSPFKMTVSLNVLNHLGINLYSNIPAVLSELVANAYDADATKVKISIGEDELVVEDDGVGMTIEEINGRFLHVGYDKRNDAHNPIGKKTRRGRLPMGRKGIGKLSVFSIARQVEVHTAKEGQRHAFVMALDAIKEQIANEGKNKPGDYYPVPLPGASVDRGTKLVLRDLKKQSNKTATFLRRRLARRFAFQAERDQFVVEIDGKPIGLDDRDYFKKIQFLWYLGEESSEYAKSAINAVEKQKIDNVIGVDEKGQPIKITGWIGTVVQPGDIEEQDNVIVLLARKKLIQEDVLAQFQEAGVYADYIVGEVNADFLDADEQEDVVTSDRQRIQEDDPRYERLKVFLRDQVVARIRREWTALRLKEGGKKARSNPVLSVWLDSHEGDNKKFAEKMLSKIETFKFSDEASKLELYKASILGFERLALKHSLSRLDELEGQEDFEATMSVLSSLDDLEAAHYHQIVKSRLDVIKTLEQRLPTDKERAIQDYLFEHLWLLDPGWERATAVPAIIEESVKTAFAGIDAGLTPEESSGRVDIRYQKVGGEHVIIELKKYDRKVTMFDLMQQIDKYIGALQKCLHAQFGQHEPPIEAICIVGHRPSDYNDRTKKMMAEQGGRVITYSEMIASAQAAYTDYLAGDRKVSRITQVVEQLEQHVLEQQRQAALVDAS